MSKLNYTRVRGWRDGSMNRELDALLEPRIGFQYHTIAHSCALYCRCWESKLVFWKVFLSNEFL